METIISPMEMSRYSRQQKDAGRSVGLVPTMGKFHEGHLSLMREARKECDTVVVSLFVNPTQFGPGEDYENYPRDPEGDQEKARGVGVDILFRPARDDICPRVSSSRVIVPDLDNKLCGVYRPVHFSGVATIVTKLFNIARPTRAYFGEKDYQQLLMVRRLAGDLHLGVEVVGCPTVREPDGLAMSSRNEYLSRSERGSAPCLYESLCLARSLVESGERDADVIKEKMRELIRARPHTKIQYVSICDTETLEDIKTINGHALTALSVYVGRARLIDNIILIGASKNSFPLQTA